MPDTSVTRRAGALVRLLGALAIVAVAGGCVASSSATASPTAVASKPSEPSQPSPSIRGDGDLRLDDCSYGGAPARCGTFRVPEDRSKAHGRRIDLRVVIVPAGSPDRAEEPLFFLSGGPGGAATEDFPWAVDVFGSLHRTRDFVMLDQRGTGGADRLVCPTDPPELGADDPETATRLAKAWVDECLAALDADLRFYGTDTFVDDVDDLRAALGYESIDLWGGSYGATAAQYYLLEYEAHVRTVTLSGPTLLGTHLIEYWPQTRDRALRGLFDACRADAACATAFPDVESEFDALVDRLAARPVTSRVFGPDARPIDVDRATLHDVTTALLLDRRSAAALPRLIHTAALGDVDPLARAWTDVANAASGGALAMRGPIMCNEDWARSDPAIVADNATGTPFATEELEAAQAHAFGCRFTPRIEVGQEYATRIRSDVPVLLLIGELDPQDPAQMSATAGRDLPNSLRVVFPGEGHSFVDTACAPGITRQFVERGTTIGVDTSCTESLVLPPFEVGS
jgi:pimeloyl-ACP methyl ester carboxylesterase